MLDKRISKLEARKLESLKRPRVIITYQGDDKGQIVARERERLHFSTPIIYISRPCSRPRQVPATPKA